jgi:hypothetical protein
MVLLAEIFAVKDGLPLHLSLLLKEIRIEAASVLHLDGEARIKLLYKPMLAFKIGFAEWMLYENGLSFMLEANRKAVSGLLAESSKKKALPFWARLGKAIDYVAMYSLAVPDQFSPLYPQLEARMIRQSTELDIDIICGMLLEERIGSVAAQPAAEAIYYGAEMMAALAHLSGWFSLPALEEQTQAQHNVRILAAVLHRQFAHAPSYTFDEARARLSA